MATDNTIPCAELRVVFHRRDDRYRQTIEQLVDGEWRAVYESLEGSAADQWPPSPVFQSLHIEQRPNSLVAFLVGMAGANHWSASIEPVENSNILQFDVACRVGETPGRLGSSYQILDADSHRRMELKASPVELGAVIRGAAQATEWSAQPIMAQPELPCTIRWRYAIGLAG